MKAGLERNGFDRTTVEKVLALLRNRRLIDDTRTINSLVASKTGKQAVGIEKMRFELERRGAPEELIETRLAEITPVSQLEDMRSLLKAKCKPTEARSKGARLLLSRGFSEDLIGGALDEFFGSDGFPD